MPDPSLGGNPYKQLRRYEKALKLADILCQYDIPLQDAEMMSPEQWTLVAQAAGVKMPSAETTALTLSMMEERKRR